MVEQRHPPVALAAGGRIAAGERDLGAARRWSTNVAPSAPRQSPQSPADELRRRADRDLRERRLDAARPRVAGRVRREREAHRLEVDEQRVGPDVVGLQRLAVERGRIVRDGAKNERSSTRSPSMRVEPARAQRPP